MKEEPKNENTRRERKFIYQTNEICVIGRQKVRYEPNVARDVYGSIEVFLEFPIKKNAKMTFCLSLYPIPLEKNADPSRNITPLEDGIKNMFIESNKLAASMIRNATGMKVKQFKYSNMGIIRERTDDDDDVVLPDGSVYKAYTNNGVIKRNNKTAPFIRKGDKVTMAQAVEMIDKEGKSHCVWECQYDPSKNFFSWFDRMFRKPFWKMFNKDLYSKRYTSKTTFVLGVNDVMYSDTLPIEEMKVSGNEEDELHETLVPSGRVI